MVSMNVFNAPEVSGTLFYILHCWKWNYVFQKYEVTGSTGGQ